MSVPHALPWDFLNASRPVRERRDWRHRGGGGKGKPKLTDDQVRAIRKDQREPAVIAKDYGISVDYAKHVQRGDTHSSVV